MSLKMTALERRSVLSLSSIMALRMIGLFMVLPVFTLYAHELAGATPLLIGLAMGIYGLFQAIFQIPFGALSDRFGRKPIIIIGLLIFALGSLLASFAHSITMMIFARALQGMGAVGSTILALIADLTRENQRTKSMAIAGMTIGFSFGIAMIVGPLFSRFISVNGLFLLAAFFGLLGIFILYRSVPTPQTLSWHRDTEPELKSFFKLLKAKELAKLNIGIFILHAIFTANFIVIPISLYRFLGAASAHQWLIYLPTLLIAFIVSLILLRIAEKNLKIKPFFLSGIILLIFAQLFLWIEPHYKSFMMLGLCFFFTGFSLLEAFLPSLISRTAPSANKGSALGIYSCAQFLGIFVGGVLGGWLYGKFSFAGVYLYCILLAIIWLIIACFMQAPRHLITQIVKILPPYDSNRESIFAKLNTIPGMVEVTFIPEDGVVYLKMEFETLKHPDFIRLKEHELANI